MGKNKVMQLANVDGFFWALSAHEVIPTRTPTPGLKRIGQGYPSSPVVCAAA